MIDDILRANRIEERRHLDVDGWRIAHEVAQIYGTTIRALVGQTRTRVVVAARAEVARRLRLRGWTLGQIGELLGSRHHTTVMNLLREAA